jgi:hypothetical protein
MKLRMAVALVCALMTTGAGCSDRVASPLNADAERSLLVQRARELQARINASGSMSDAHRHTLALLMRDVQAWQAATGRADLAFLGRGAACDAAAAVSAHVNTSAKVPVGVCVPVVVMGDLICFIESKEGGRCKYVCMIGFPQTPSR